MSLQDPVDLSGGLGLHGIDLCLREAERLLLKREARQFRLAFELPLWDAASIRWRGGCPTAIGALPVGRLHLIASRGGRGRCGGHWAGGPRQLSRRRRGRAPSASLRSRAGHGV